MASESEPGEIDAQEWVYLWPCNVHAWNTWLQVQTQWRTSMGGREGLDYGGVDCYLSSRPGLRPKARAELLAGLRAMELAALGEWAKQRKD